MLNLTKSTTSGEDCYTKYKTYELNTVCVCVCSYVPCECTNVVGNGDKGDCCVVIHHDEYTFSSSSFSFDLRSSSSC